MDAIIPLIDNYTAPLHMSAGTSALDSLFTALHSATALDRVTFVGNDTRLLARAEGAGFAAVQWRIAAEFHSVGVLLPGGVEALERYAAEGSRTLLVSCLNPLLTGETLDGFVRQAETARFPTVSVISARDHPCQMFQHVRVLNTGAILPLAPQPAHFLNNEERFFTHPFRFMWSARQVRGKGPFFVLDASSAEGLLFSVSDGTNISLHGPLLVRESEGFARLSLLKAEVRDLAAALGISLNDVTGIGLHLATGLPCLSYRGADDTDYVGFSFEHQKGRLCQVYAQDKRHGERRASLYLSDDSYSAALPWPLDRVEPIFYTLMDYLDNDGQYDLPQSFPEMPHGLWSTDPVTCVCVNNLTGRSIHGRQDFPEVLELDGSLYALTPGEALSFNDMLQGGEVAPFLLAPSQSLILRTHFDILRYKARLRLEAL